ncbi:MAG TPA: L,D-transpeptidase [Solirubrobacteraceae bacterium]|nr:L,D-transpeptidase [Solirubrobacteraceae bacterium]
MRLATRIGLLAATAVSLSAAATSAAAAVPPATRVVRLSNEVTVTRWAHPLEVADIWTEPFARGRRVARLHMSTEEGWPEVYLVLADATAPGRETWLRIRVPGRPNGRTGWVRRNALGRLNSTDMDLRVNLGALRATLLRDGRPIWHAPIGDGKPSTPTPTGHFWIRELMQVPPGSIYGPYAFGTSDYSTLSEWPNGGVVGIHGTNEPWLIPGHPSHGCIRMRNASITYLAYHLPIGAPVEVFR